MHEDSSLTYTCIYGDEISLHAEKVAQFRIKYFRDFPYLYEGNLEYEKRYLEGYARDKTSILVLVTNSQADLLAVSTALPLVTPSEILSDAFELFHQAGYKPHHFFYYGEIILDYSLRGKGVARKIYDLQDQFAKDKGFTKIAIATVIRDDDDPRKPPGYKSSDFVWRNFGFEQTGIKFEYHWPTLMRNGSVEEILNPMIYWVKDLTK